MTEIALKYRDPSDLIKNPFDVTNMKIDHESTEIYYHKGKHYICLRNTTYDEPVLSTIQLKIPIMRATDLALVAEAIRHIYAN